MEALNQKKISEKGIDDVAEDFILVNSAKAVAVAKDVEEDKLELLLQSICNSAVDQQEECILVILFSFGDAWWNTMQITGSLIYT